MHCTNKNSFCWHICSSSETTRVHVICTQSILVSKPGSIIIRVVDVRLIVHNKLCVEHVVTNYFVYQAKLIHKDVIATNLQIVRKYVNPRGVSVYQPIENVTLSFARVLKQGGVFFSILKDDIQYLFSYKLMSMIQSLNVR